jgi:hypothetical protein
MDSTLRVPGGLHGQHTQEYQEVWAGPPGQALLEVMLLSSKA